MLWNMSWRARDNQGDVATCDGARHREKIPTLLVLCLSFASVSTAADTAPDMLVRIALEEVLGALARGLDGRPLQTMVEQKVLPYFDFRAMTRLALGCHWRDATPEQQKALEQAFRGLLLRSCDVALNEAGRGERRVEVRPLVLKPGDDYVTVHALLREGGRPPYCRRWACTLSTSLHRPTA
ncbi:MAG: phospholipid-binding protein MlaC [Betaproteobacteria bacterium]|jgi:phospholipid transport system substrate-binding protein